MIVCARSLLVLAAAACWCLAAQHPGLAPIEAIGDLEKRSRQALEFAHELFEEAAASYSRGDLGKGQATLDAIGDAVELAVESLQATGKHPRKHPRHFKHAEIRTRKLLQRLREARREAHLEDQGDFEDLIGRVEQSNGELLLGIMSRRD